jgi:hypothetical protein
VKTGCFILTWIHTRKPVSSYNINTLIVVKTNLFLQLLIIKRLNTGFVTRVTRMVSHVEQDFNLFTHLELMSSPTVFSGNYVVRSLVWCFVDRCLFLFFYSLYCLSPLFTASDYHFGIFKLLLDNESSMFGVNMD